MKFRALHSAARALAVNLVKIREQLTRKARADQERLTKFARNLAPSVPTILSHSLLDDRREGTL